MNLKVPPRRVGPLFGALALLCAWLCFDAPPLAEGAPDVDWSAAAKPLADEIGHLRGLADDVRGAAIQDLAIRIRRLPAAADKLRLAIYLAGLSTEGDYGRNVLHDVAETLAAAVRESPIPWTKPQASDAGKFVPALMPVYAYRELAQLARYEQVPVALAGDAHFRAAMAVLESNDRKRDHPDFTLNDLSGKPWRSADLRGKVMLVNFWATWCPPCRKELPALESLQARFAQQGLVVLGITDEDAAKVDPFVREHAISYTVLLDPGRAVNKSFAIQGIPKTFIYDRTGRLVAEAIDMRTPAQFLAMLQKAGLH